MYNKTVISVAYVNKVFSFLYIEWSPFQVDKLTMSVIISDNILCSAHLRDAIKAGLAVFLPPDEESAAVKHSEAAHTNRGCSCIMYRGKHEDAFSLREW